MKRSKEDVQHAYEQLRRLCPKGSTVYCILKGVSRSGMSRNIEFYAIQDDKRPQWLTGYMSAIGVVNQSRKDWEQSKGAKVHGCGMDMGFHCVSNLAHALYKAEGSLTHAWL